MKVKYSLRYGGLTLVMLAASPVQAGWLDFLSDSTEEAAETMQQGSETLNRVDSALQTGKAATEAVPATQSELTGILMQQTGVTQVQAEGGAGAIFQLAKQRMSEEAFGRLNQAVPGMDGLLAAAPQQSTSLGGLAAGALGGNSTVGSAVSLISAFQQLDLSQGMVTQFTPIVVDYVKQRGGPELGNLLQLAIMGSQ